LAPVVYLSQSTQNIINGTGGATVMANDASFSGKAFKNSGGKIITNNKLDINVKNDIENISGEISGGDVSLKSATGNIINKTLSKTRGSAQGTQRTQIGNTAIIKSTNTLNLDAKKDILIEGAKLISSGSAKIKAEGDFKVTTIVDKFTSFEGEESVKAVKTETGGFGIKRTLKDRVITEKNIGSTLSFGGDLEVNTEGKTTISGSKLTAQGDGNIISKGGVEINSVKDKRSVTSASSTQTIGGDSLFGSSSNKTKTEAEINKSSEVSFGGNLNIDFDKKVIVLGSDLSVQGKGRINAKEGMEVRSVQNKLSTSSESSKSGFGGDSLYSESSVKTDSFKGSNKASNVEFGESVNIKTEGKFVLQGSNLKTGEGESSISAKKGIDILDGLDEETSVTTTEKFSLFGSSSGSSSSSAGASAETNTGTNTNASFETGDMSAEAGANASSTASAGANASAEASADGTVNVFTKSKEIVNKNKKTSVASNLFSAGNLKLDAGDNDLNVVGSDVESTGNLDIDAKDINILSGRNEETITIEKTTSSFDMGFASEASAEAGASAGASSSANASADAAAGFDDTLATAGANVGVDAKATAEAKASTSAEAKTGLTAGLTTTNENSKEYTLKNRGSSLKSGNNMTLRSKGDTTLQGADVEVGGDFENTGKNIKYWLYMDSRVVEKSQSKITSLAEMCAE